MTWKEFKEYVDHRIDNENIELFYIDTHNFPTRIDIRESNDGLIIDGF